MGEEVESHTPQQLLEQLMHKVKRLSARMLADHSVQHAKTNAAGKRVRMSEREGDQEFISEAMHDLEGATLTRLTEQPPNVRGKMRPYQLAGLNWMIRLHELGLNGILADEMGLGKTLECISLLAYHRHFRNVTGPYLVIVPKSTMPNWIREFEMWCPDFKALKLDGVKEERRKFVKSHVKTQKFDVLVTSYEIAIIEKSALKKIDWEYLVIDEAHRLKNEKSLLSSIVRTFRSKNRLLMTGTPLQNNLHELWALLNFLLPSIFDSSEAFENLFEFTENKESESEILNHLHKLLQPFLLRRLKVDVAKDIPPKTETLLFVGMSALQKRVYKKILMREMGALQGAMKQKTQLLNIVMQLRKTTNHPYLFEGVEDRSLDPFGEHVVESAGKLVVLDKLLKKLRSQGSRVLIFSQMTRMLDILEDFCCMRSYKYCRIDGSTESDDRQSQMDSFNAPNSEEFLFLLSTRAGGLGINLATADIVIIFDSDWNPQMDLQAQDRAHRIGQKKPVFVYRFVTQDSVEEKVIERAELKLRLDAMIIQQGRLSQQNKGISKDDMLEMIRYGADKVLRSSEASITDEDIDILLDRGKEHTKRFNEKVQKHVKTDNVGFKLDSANYLMLDGVDYTDAREKQRQERLKEFEIMSTLHDAMGKRERKRPKVDYNMDDYFRAKLAPTRMPKAKKYKKIRVRKLPCMHDFQFYDKTRLHQLHEKEVLFATKYDYKEVPEGATALSEDEEAERTRLLSEGFSSWNRLHFYAYVRACKLYGRDNIASVRTAVDTKTPEEVDRYHREFWKRAGSSEDLDRYVKNVERGESKLLKEREQWEVIHRKVSAYERPELELRVKMSAQSKGKGFITEEDRFLLCAVDRLGYGKWDDLKVTVRSDSRFRFDYFLKSRTAAELGRRVEVLVRLLQKEEDSKGGRAAGQNVQKDTAVSG
eukprot:462434_1